MAGKHSCVDHQGAYLGHMFVTVLRNAQMVLTKKIASFPRLARSGGMLGTRKVAYIKSVSRLF